MLMFKNNIIVAISSKLLFVLFFGFNRKDLWNRRKL